MNHSVEEVLAKLEGAYAPNTLKGYRCDFGVFDRFCLERGFTSCPSSVDTLIEYLESSIATRKPQTLYAPRGIDAWIGFDAERALESGR